MTADKRPKSNKKVFFKYNLHNIEITVDGVWLQWSIWSQCDSTCGQGRTSRNRICSQPQHGGRNCEGGQEEIQECQARNKCRGNFDNLT